jgi:CubicO group peptidase (beta-lactamase class C family)
MSYRSATAIVALVTLQSVGLPATHPRAAAAENGSALDGQLVIDVTAELGDPVRREGTFEAPAGWATLVVDAAPGTIGLVLVNGKPAPEAMRALREGGRHEVTLDRWTQQGENHLEIRAFRGSARVVVAFPTLTGGNTADVDMDAAALARIDDAMAEFIGPDPEDRFPGAVVLVARHGVVVKHTAYGAAQTYDGDRRLETPREMTTDTIFDLASITKVAATTAAVMHLVDEGRLDLDAPAARYLPELREGAKDTITLRHLLTHRSGLWEWQPTYLHARTQEAAIDYVTDLDLRYEVGEDRHYSDLGFMLLGEIVERVTGQPLETYVRESIHEPLGMTDTTYRPAPSLRPRIAATSHDNHYEERMIATGVPYPILGDDRDFDDWRDYTLVGEVNDGNAYYGFEGVAGHAGLFGTAHDLAVYGQALANGGGYGTTRLWSSATVSEFTSDQFDYGQGLGFWTHRLDAVDGLGDGGFGHGGFTGTEFLVAPEQGLVVVMLTNRNHPDLPLNSVYPAWQTVLGAVSDSIAEWDCADDGWLSCRFDDRGRP